MAEMECLGGVGEVAVKISECFSVGWVIASFCLSG
jgi:hypothetical protein